MKYWKESKTGRYRVFQRRFRNKSLFTKEFEDIQRTEKDMLNKMRIYMESVLNRINLVEEIFQN